MLLFFWPALYTSWTQILKGKLPTKKIFYSWLGRLFTIDRFPHWFSSITFSVRWIYLSISASVFLFEVATFQVRKFLVKKYFFKNVYIDIDVVNECWFANPCGTFMVLIFNIFGLTGLNITWFLTVLNYAFGARYFYL